MRSAAKHLILAVLLLAPAAAALGDTGSAAAGPACAPANTNCPNPVTPPVDCKPNAACTFQCPVGRYLNCMPTIVCSKEYVDWVKQNCPGVEIVY